MDSERHVPTPRNKLKSHPHFDQDPAQKCNLRLCLPSPPSAGRVHDVWPAPCPRLDVSGSALWALEGCTRFQARPPRRLARSLAPKFQCSPLSQGEGNKVTRIKLQRVYYQLSLAALSRKREGAGCCSGLADGWVPELQETSPRDQCLLSTLRDHFSWYFYSRLRSLLACGRCTASGSSVSAARGLLSEVYIQPPPPPPCSEQE